MKTIHLIIFFFASCMLGIGQISPAPAGFSCDIPIFSESFEGGVPAGWSNIELDSIKLGTFNEGWVVDRDETFTPNTGPDMAQDGDFYVYCDGSGPVGRGDPASMFSPLIDVGPGFRPAMTFYLNMFGRSGSFFVRVHEGGDITTVLDPVSGDVDGGIHAMSEWEEIYIDLNPWRNKTIQLEFGTIKPINGFIGDVAVDNIVICSSSNPIPTLSQWSVMILGLILLILATVSLQNREDFNPALAK